MLGLAFQSLGALGVGACVAVVAVVSGVGGEFPQCLRGDGAGLVVWRPASWAFSLLENSPMMVFLSCRCFPRTVFVRDAWCAR